ncbi:MAG: hypothetical protein AAF628_24210 [Planctomycetota bacterium]
MKRYTTTFAGLVALALLALGLSFIPACSSTYPRRDPTGETFPTVRGESLAGDDVELPAIAAGQPLLLLIGYDQDAQFDIDRWLLGLTQAEVGVRMLELPTIPGMFPRMFSGTIDGGMRRGIPREDWGGVVTLYADAEPVAQFTGNADGLTGRVVLLDGEGRVRFFHDRGYSVGSLQRLSSTLHELSQESRGERGE